MKEGRKELSCIWSFPVFACRSLLRIGKAASLCVYCACRDSYTVMFLAMTLTLSQAAMHLFSHDTIYRITGT